MLQSTLGRGTGGGDNLICLGKIFFSDAEPELLDYQLGDLTTAAILSVSAERVQDRVFEKVTELIRVDREATLRKECKGIHQHLFALLLGVHPTPTLVDSEREARPVAEMTGGRLHKLRPLRRIGRNGR